MSFRGHLEVCFVSRVVFAKEDFVADMFQLCDVKWSLISAPI